MQPASQFGEPLWSEDQFTYHQEGPPITDEVEGAGNPTGVVVAVYGGHGPSLTLKLHSKTKKS